MNLTDLFFMLTGAAVGVICFVLGYLAGRSD